MENTEPYGPFHLAFFCLGVPAAVVAARLSSRLSQKGGRALLLSLGVLLLLGETYKQLFYIAVDGEPRAEYFPFQLCSVPMYVCLAAPFVRNEKAYRTLTAFLATFGLMGGAASYISPGSMIHPYLAMTLHSFIWHLLLIFLGVWAALSQIASLEKGGFRAVLAMYLILAAAAFAINTAFHGSHPEVNMFYIGPTPSDLPVCREITARFGVAVNSIVYISALSLCAFLIFSAWRLIYRLCPKLFSEKNSPKEPIITNEDQ